MKKKYLLPAVLVAGVLGGSTYTYASIFGEENIILGKQLFHLVKISKDMQDNLNEARKAVDVAMDTRDMMLQSKALVEDLVAHSDDRFIEDFKGQLLNAYPDIGYMVDRAGLNNLDSWTSANMGSSASSFDLIGKVYGEITDDVLVAGKEGKVDLTDAGLARSQAAAGLTAATSTENFIEKTSDDIEKYSELLRDTENKDEAVVIQAKIQAIIAAQNNHLLRMRSVELRNNATEDARRYQEKIKATSFGIQAEEEEKKLDETLNKTPKFMEFHSPFMEP